MNFIFPTKFIYWEKILEHQKIKKKYFNSIKKDIEENKILYKTEVEKIWQCSCVSSYFSNSKIFSELEEKNFFKDIIWDPMDNMLKKMNDTINLPIPKHSKLTRIWFNYYEPGNWQEAHEHSDPATYSGIYLLDLNEKNPTIFFDENSSRCWGRERNPSMVTFSTEDIEEGTVIFFPSELMHYVNPCKSNRTTISFNISSEF